MKWMEKINIAWHFSSSSWAILLKCYPLFIVSYTGRNFSGPLICGLLRLSKIWLQLVLGHHLLDSPLTMSLNFFSLRTILVHIAWSKSETPSRNISLGCPPEQCKWLDHVIVEALGMGISLGDAVLRTFSLFVNIPYHHLQILLHYSLSSLVLSLRTTKNAW